MLDSLYIGKVIYDSDLLGKNDTVPNNRVKVFINGLTPSGPESFKQPRGKTNERIISKNSLDVIGKEFYAYVMMPVMGSGTGAKYNASTDILTVSDTGNIRDLNAQPPAEAYSHIQDGYTGGNSIGTAGVNVTAGAYSPDNRSNAYKGMLALPGVGATVVVSFINGERSMPIVLGVVPGEADVESIHGVGFNEEVYPNYPVGYSNLTEQSLASNATPTTPDNGTTTTTSTSATSGDTTTTTTTTKSSDGTKTTTTKTTNTKSTTTVTTGGEVIVTRAEIVPEENISIGNATIVAYGNTREEREADAQQRLNNYYKSIERLEGTKLWQNATPEKRAKFVRNNQKNKGITFR